MPDFEFEHEGEFQYVPTEVLREFLCESLPDTKQMQVKARLIEGDSMNAPIRPFLEYMAKGMVACYYQAG